MMDRRSELRLVAFLALVAMVRVFVFSAAFPFFGINDEAFHMDLILKYARGYVPKPGNDRLEPESARLLATFASPEYLTRPGEFPNGKVPPPVWHSLPPTAASQNQLARTAGFWLTQRSIEAHSPPVYYKLGALWLKAGRGLGLWGLSLLYWTRFANVFLFGILVVVTFLLARQWYPENRAVYLGAPMLMALFPQDAFFTINNDGLSAVFFALTLLWLNSLALARRPFYWYLGTGLLVGATFLIKVINAIVVVPAAFYSALLLWRARRENRVLPELGRCGLLWAASALLVGIWMAGNLHRFGDLTASNEKIALLGWTRKPASELLHHPFFSLEGFTFFWAELFRTFWRGEQLWGMKLMAFPSTDAFYSGSSVLVLLAIVVLAFRQRESKELLFVRLLCLCSILAGAALLIYLSLLFDYGNCFRPSRRNPFFNAGRLILAVLVPFLCLYADTLAFLLGKITRRLNPLWGMGILALAIFAIELAAKAPIFSSQYNFFAQ
jgi:4-amino-4-deoxy-L-arabinose transferase-like glycosyltransferase